MSLYLGITPTSTGRSQRPRWGFGSTAPQSHEESSGTGNALSQVGLAFVCWVARRGHPRPAPEELSVLPVSASRAYLPSTLVHLDCDMHQLFMNTQLLPDVIRLGGIHDGERKDAGVLPLAHTPDV